MLPPVIAVPLIAPPVIWAFAVTRLPAVSAPTKLPAPSAPMVKRVVPSVLMTSGFASVVPRNCVAGLVPALPPKSHAREPITVSRLAWPSAPEVLPRTMRSKLPRVSAGVAPPSEASVTFGVPGVPATVRPVLPTVAPPLSAVRPVTVSELLSVVAPETPSVPPTVAPLVTPREFRVARPVLSSVVKRPVLAVVAPIGVPLMLPPVIAVPLIAPPVIWALLVTRLPTVSAP